MPQLIFKGINKENVKRISKELIDELHDAVGCPRDYFTLAIPETIYISDGEEVFGNPLVQVTWFDRGQSVQDHTAAIITRHLQLIGYPHIDIFFILLEKSSYYEDGEHY